MRSLSSAVLVVEGLADADHDRVNSIDRTVVSVSVQTQMPSNLVHQSHRRSVGAGCIVSLRPGKGKQAGSRAKAMTRATLLQNCCEIRSHITRGDCE